MLAGRHALLVDFGVAKALSALTLRPDGRLVAFSSAGALLVVRSDGDSIRTLVARGEGRAPRAVYVDWSDDGRRVYYLAVDPAERMGRLYFTVGDRQSDVWLADLGLAQRE